MKKLFSIASIFLLILTLAGCQDGVNQDDLDVRDATIASQQEQLVNLQEELDNSVEENEGLLQQISDLQALIFDNVITFTLTDEHGVFTSKTVGYNDDFEGTLFDLLDEYYLVSYSETDFGNYILSIDHLKPKVGAYISFSKNGEASMVGVESSTFEDKDFFSFEVVWWDNAQKAVDDAIYLFLENQANDFVSDEYVDYNVLVALYQLDMVSNYITSTELETIVSIETPVTVNDYFKTIIKMQTVGLNSDSLIADLNSMVAVGPFGQTAYGLIALDSYTHSTDYSAFVINALADLNTVSPYDLGLDAGGISLVALSNYTAETGVQDLIDEYTTWISTSQLDSGGLKPRDVIWGETTYPGTENAASIAQVIIGLIANGIDPTGTEYTKSGNNLITRLIEFQTETGSFDWAFDDDYPEDLLFSTPQAFLALVVYQNYVNTYGAVNPYDFN